MYALQVSDFENMQNDVDLNPQDADHKSRLMDR